MENNITIRKMEFEDLIEVFRLGEKIFSADKWTNLYRTWDEYELMSFFMSDEDYCFVAEDEKEKLVGFILGTIIEKNRSAWNYGYIVWLAIQPGLRGSGLGTRLVRYLTKIFKKEKVRIILADTQAQNKGALNFFKKLGFENEVPHVYLSKNIDED